MTPLAYIVAILALAGLLAAFACLRARRALAQKAEQSRRCLASLSEAAGLEGPFPVTFVADLRRLPQFVAACFRDNPFPRYRAILCFLRLRGVAKLFRREKVLQTPAAAAALAAVDKAARDVGGLRSPSGADRAAACDVAFAGLQAIRLYLAHYEGEAFRKARFESCFRVNNAFNGSFYKFGTADGRHVSFHVYYQSQKAKLVKALSLEKPAEAFSMETSKADRRVLAAKVAGMKAEELEELAFASGASACVLRSRAEWEATPVGRAVGAMPLLSLRKTGDFEPRRLPAPNQARGPLSGLKVLDLTHIIAGPACTRLLAEYGADVLLVRRGAFLEQEQAFLELDGWAGKRSIQLDFEKPADLARAKELVKEADVVVSSYQRGALDRFGLGEAGVRALNPRAVYGSLMCFSDSVWAERPGWAPLAEDITGLSVRNGSLTKPKNLNGVPLDYIPGFILALGVLEALKKSLKEGGGYTVTASLTRTAVWLHECTDLCAAPAAGPLPGNAATGKRARAAAGSGARAWDSVLTRAPDTSVGAVRFPSPAVVGASGPAPISNLRFTDGNEGWGQ